MSVFTILENTSFTRIQVHDENLRCSFWNMWGGIQCVKIILEGVMHGDSRKILVVVTPRGHWKFLRTTCNLLVFYKSLFGKRVVRRLVRYSCKSRLVQWLWIRLGAAEVVEKWLNFKSMGHVGITGFATDLIYHVESERRGKSCNSSDSVWSWLQSSPISKLKP